MEEHSAWIFKALLLTRLGKALTGKTRVQHVHWLQAVSRHGHFRGAFVKQSHVGKIVAVGFSRVLVEFHRPSRLESRLLKAQTKSADPRKQRTALHPSTDHSLLRRL